MIRLTRTGWLFLGVAALLYLASLTSQSSPLLFLIGILLGCYVINTADALRAMKGIRIEAPASSHSSEGERITDPWRIINTGSAPAEQVLIRLGGETVLRIPRIDAGATLSQLPSMTFSRRGVHRLQDLQITTRFPFGLVESKRSIPSPGEVVVFPAIYPTTCPTAAGFDVMVGGKYSGRRHTASGAHFAGVRPMQSGDPFKNISWKASSKGLGMMVKTYEEELSGRVAVILDVGTPQNTVLLDDAIRAAGSLIFAALDAGHHAELIDLARRESQLYPPFTDGTEILEHLARIEPPTGPGSLTADALRHAVERVSRRAALALILTDCPAALHPVLLELQAARRNVTVYLPISSKATTGDAAVIVRRFDAKQIFETA
ncbi:MAG TPA: DUF58 domain-containing protein [Roseimicrobium sp.]|nr:DUF58 domain-containing protein [Roseimicrobium sp.]